MKKISLTPEEQAAVDQMTAESQARTDNYLTNFRAALPGLPIPDTVKAEFEKAAESMQKRWGTPPK